MGHFPAVPSYPKVKSHGQGNRQREQSTGDETSYGGAAPNLDQGRTLQLNVTVLTDIDEGSIAITSVNQRKRPFQLFGTYETLPTQRNSDLNVFTYLLLRHVFVVSDVTMVGVNNLFAQCSRS